ncbi:hypothetical protein F5B22DRAFT_230328 [Xylaria bambusicola]|uniref:uncharacterized protein n=1 Tax=Xylaria bambusicola TaxID=326684 RepID=UPI0020087E56|nr:uncharacterized protein F5B22DRAFT_230328 [Xylaria bambusicola]KAI0514498.1 hypothetical protein F5B22DRAFT_230328 [Xylaria bambusicola]
MTDVVRAPRVRSPLRTREHGTLFALSSLFPLLFTLHTGPTGSLRASEVYLHYTLAVESLFSVVVRFYSIFPPSHITWRPYAMPPASSPTVVTVLGPLTETVALVLFDSGPMFQLQAKVLLY